jgi:5-(carboxyamino)imidazole ribonucleotide mutase
MTQYDNKIMTKPIIGIIMGSDSDLNVMQEVAKILEEFKVPFEISVLSAHRTPDDATKYAKTAINRGLKIIIAGAGGAAHLAGVVAANTVLPVIGVPINSKLNGVDSFVSTLQMPPGIPVATVAIDGAKNAGLLAVEILAISDGNLSNKLSNYKKVLAKNVLEKSKKLKKLGYKKYLAK